MSEIQEEAKKIVEMIKEDLQKAARLKKYLEPGLDNLDEQDEMAKIIKQDLQRLSEVKKVLEAQGIKSLDNVDLPMLTYVKLVELGEAVRGVGKEVGEARKEIEEVRKEVGEGFKEVRKGISDIRWQLAWLLGAAAVAIALLVAIAVKIFS